MAQVKKLQQGGVLNLNGKQYTAEQINEYINQAGLSSQERAALAGTVNAIASGQIRDLDRNANSLSGIGVTDDFVNFYGNEKRAQRNETGKSTRWANRQARKNSDFHIANTAISKLGGIEDYFNNVEKKKKSNDSSKTLKKGSGYFKYDNTGKYVDNAENYAYLDVVDRIFRYLNDSDKES